MKQARLLADFIVRDCLNETTGVGDLRKLVLKELGGRCINCGFTDPRALQVDHIHGGGNRLLKTISKVAQYREILSTDTSHKYQLLCANCNWIKRAINKEHKQSNQPNPFAKKLAKFLEDAQDQVQETTEETREPVEVSAGYYGVSGTSLLDRQAEMRHRHLFRGNTKPKQRRFFYREFVTESETLSGLS